MNCSRPPPGFFGKLPSHGDFVERRLPPEVRLRLDKWVQEGLVQSKIDLGEAWLPTWLSSPLWRFLISMGVCDEQAWAGVMMPSHDRVGRCFPLLLATGLDGTPSLRNCLTVHKSWFERLEELALFSVQADSSLETFDAAVISLDRAPDSGFPPNSRSELFPTSVGVRATGSVIGLDDATSLDELMEGQSAWWTDGSSQVAPCLAICDGMPSPMAFGALLDGHWMGHRWTST